MPQLKDFIQLQTTSGDPQTIGDATITPQSQALIVRFPFGGFVWNRPVAVLVDRNGQTERIPIVDVTRIAQAERARLDFSIFDYNRGIRRTPKEQIT